MHVQEVTNTEFVLIQTSKLDKGVWDDLLTRHPDINIILSMYSNNTRIVEEYLESIKNESIETSNVHSFQGDERDVVVVFLHNNENGKWELNGDKRYLASALTRAKKKLILLVVEFHK